MNEINSKIKINASQEKVWKIISEIDNDPAYWKGITRLRNISKEQNVITRDVFLSGDNKCQQRVILFPKEGIHIKWLRGPIIGVRDILLSAGQNMTMLEVQMTYTLCGVVKMFSKNTAKDLQKEVNLALELIKEESEGRKQQPALEKRRLWSDLIHDRT